jgi:uncharacterized protein YbjT (DUF2867 family)
MNSPGPHARRRQAPAIIEGPVVVAGATGNVGRELVPLLLRSDIEVRALRRTPARDTFEADLTNRSSLFCQPVKRRTRCVPRGTDPRPGRGDTQPLRGRCRVTIRRALRPACIINRRTRRRAPSIAAHRAAEDALVSSGLRVTVLGAGWFTSNVLHWARAIRSRAAIDLPRPEAPQALIDPLDIALVATVALAGRAPEVCTLTGPEVLTPVEQINVLSDVIGRELTWIERPLADGDRGTALLRDDVPWAKATTSIRQLTGLRSQTFRDWAARHASSFT